MMPSLSAQIKETWLDTAVPVSLDSMVDYQKALAQAGDFALKLKSLNWPGTMDFNNWVTSAPKTWLNKRRESSLDWVRNELALGRLNWIRKELGLREDCSGITQVFFPFIISLHILLWGASISISNGLIHRNWRSSDCGTY